MWISTLDDQEEKTGPFIFSPEISNQMILHEYQIEGMIYAADQEELYGVLNKGQYCFCHYLSSKDKK